jgi:chromatin remodeling complex protein RSC6
MADKPLTTEDAKKEGDLLAEKKGNQYRTVQAYLEATSYVNFSVREDFYNYFGVKPTVASTAKRAVPRRPAKTATSTDTNKGNGVSYENKSGKLPDKKIQVPTTGGDAPLVHSKTTKRKKWMTFHVPSYLSSSAIALWINTAFDANRRPTFFVLESGTKVRIDPTFTDPSKLKALKSFKTD